MAFISGEHTVTWNGSSLGQSRGINVEWVKSSEKIVGDNFADTPQDGIHLGVIAFVDMTLLEYDAVGLRAAIWPWGTFGDIDQVGKQDVASYAKPLVLSGVAGPPAAGDLWTFPISILAEGFPVRLLFGPQLREIPFRLDVYPDSSGILFIEA